MKRIISVLLVVLVFLLTFTITSFAGSIPEDILDEDSAKLYIGTLESFSHIAIASAPNMKITSMTITPVHKFKGDVEIGKTQTYNNCNFYMKLCEGNEYLFVDFTQTDGSAAIYAYEIASKADKQISLKDSLLYEQTRRLEEYINDGTVARAEEERASLGSVVSLEEFLDVKSIKTSEVSNVIFTYKGDRYDVPLESFFDIAGQIYITNVKDTPIQNYGKDGAFDSVLYINLVDEAFHELSCVAITELGEVSRNSPSMSILPCKDYTMDTLDLSKLQKLLSDNSTTILTRLNNEYSSQSEFTLEYDALTAIASIVCVVILAAAVYIFIKKRYLK